MNTRSLVTSMLLLAAFATSSRAQLADSVFANTIIAQDNVENSAEALGRPDNKDAILNPHGLFDLGFTFGGGLLTMNKGAVLHIYWNKNGTDSAAAFMTFERLTESGALVYAKDTVIVSEPNGQVGMLSVTVPDTGFNALDFSLTDSIKNGIPITGFGAKYFFLDAITLIQPVNAVKHSEQAQTETRLYPNPLPANAHAAFEFTMAHSGAVKIVVTDMLGRTIESFELGNQPVGQRSVPLHFGETGLYLVQLFVDGAKSGSAIKLAAE